jgi:hypothetical protein
VSNDRQELIRRFAVAIAGAQSVKTFDDRMSEQEIWRQAKFMADTEPPQRPADDRIERALKLLRDAQAYDCHSVYVRGVMKAGRHNAGDWVEVEVLTQVRKILEGQE